MPVAAGSLGTGCSPILAPGGTVACDAFSSLSTSIATATDGTFALTVSFLLSGGDGAQIAGRAELTNTAVPEPATLLLLALGIGVLAAMRGGVLSGMARGVPL